ncbi:MAG: hypothetical protein A2521_07425 [Deltaproteobacteria bacterium RIFOXYD12_FULL_57_12]|nr:MAG: hypothetical protein A2521_07425 [Deltaproteobacteria bacterium RIFOXYD12_FULL_57_12]
MPSAFILTLCGLLLLVGGAVTVAFWLPGLVNRPKLKEMLGPRYPLVYVIYGANGPFLVLLALVLYLIFGQS